MRNKCQKNVKNLRTRIVIDLGFVEVRNCTVFQGNYPDKLLNLWDAFEDEKGSENTRPDFLPRDQLYIALEFNNGGQEQ